MRWRPAPASQGFLRSGVVAGRRADGPSMAQRRSLGIHAERTPPQRLHSASRRAFRGVHEIAALHFKWHMRAGDVGPALAGKAVCQLSCYRGHGGFFAFDRVLPTKREVFASSGFALTVDPLCHGKGGNRYALASGPCFAGVPSLRRCGGATRRRAFHGPTALARHPCRAHPTTTPALSLPTRVSRCS